jgi:hypothetical protein
MFTDGLALELVLVFPHGEYCANDDTGPAASAMAKSIAEISIVEIDPYVFMRPPLLHGHIMDRSLVYHSPKYFNRRGRASGMALGTLIELSGGCQINLRPK